jgi:nucleoid-associated protein YgaU
MAFPDLFKLEKLKIEAFSDRERQRPEGEPVEAMFNPTTVNQRYGVRYVPSRRVDGVRQAAHFERVLPTTLDVQLLFDGTGVDQIGLLTLFGKNKTVGERIEDLLTACYRVNGDIHEPNFLTVTWGQFLKRANDGGFRGRLSSLAINYASFNRDGSPLRAQCDLSLTADDDPDRQGNANPLFSPDVTHSRLVREGDTLPLLTAEVYGSTRHVVEVARHNDLDHFRALEPGRTLLFPPIGP